MTTQKITEYCLSKRKAFLDFPFGESPACIKVYGRIFAEVYSDSYPVRVTLKCEPMLADFYRREYPGTVLPGYHVPTAQKIYRNTVVASGLPEEELFRMIDHSYQEVIKKFTRQMREDYERD